MKADSLFGSSATAIAIQGHDVYAAGYSSPNGKAVATFWKNGVATYLSDPNDTLKNSYANLIAVIGNNVYTAGTIGFVSIVAWKNTTQTVLYNDVDYSGVYAITTSGSDVYLAGTIENVATYCKNNASVSLPEGVYADGIAIKNNNVYISGNGKASNGNLVALSWKNGVVKTLSDGSSLTTTTGIAIQDTDVYVLGVIGGNNYVTTLWKNGIINNMANQTSLTLYGSGIWINGNDIYIGIRSPQVDNQYVSYLKNGVNIQLSNYGIISNITFLPY